MFLVVEIEIEKRKPTNDTQITWRHACIDHIEESHCTNWLFASNDRPSLRASPPSQRTVPLQQGRPPYRTTSLWRIPATPPLMSKVRSPYSEMALALDFAKGHAFEEAIGTRWKLPINYEDHSGLCEFLLVAKFKRSKIWLTHESVSTILLSCFGGRASLFKVSRFQNWSFKFYVSSKEVGFAIFNGGNISTNEFNLGFLRWGRGGRTMKKNLFFTSKNKKMSGLVFS